MTNIFAALGNVLSRGVEEIGRGIAAERLGPDFRKKAEMLGRLNEIEIATKRQEPELRRMDIESRSYNRKALEDAANERAGLTRIQNLVGLGLAGKLDDPELTRGVSPREIETARGLAELERLKIAPKTPQQKVRSLTPEQAQFYGLQAGDYSEEYVNDIAQRKNAEAGRAATQQRFEDFPVMMQGIDPTTGQPTVMPTRRGDVVAGGGVKKAAPATAVESLAKFDQADEALRLIEQDMGQFQNASLLNPVEKAMSGYELQRKKNALSVQLGRALGEVGVFTDQDRETYARLMGPGLILTELAPEKTQEWFNETKAFLTKMREKRRQHFQRSFGYLPGEAVSGPNVDYETNRARLGGEPPPAGSDIDEIEALIRGPR